MKQKPFTPASARKGFTLIELLISMTIAIIIVSVAISLIFAMRRVQRFDQARTTINQNLRAASDIIGTDLQQAGQGLDDSFQSIVFYTDDNGNDVLIVRRSLSPHALNACKHPIKGEIALITTSNSVKNDNGRMRPECDGSDSGTVNSIEEGLANWEVLRQEAGGTLRAFIYDVEKDFGEFFNYNGYTQNTSHSNNQNAHEQYDVRADGDFSNQHYKNIGFDTNLPQLYILEERRYRINPEDGSLEFILNGMEDNPQTLAFHISDFEVSATINVDDEDSTGDDIVITALFANGEAINEDEQTINGITLTNNPDANPKISWTRIRNVSISFTGVESRDGPNTRTFTADFLPRNVF
jgi:type II secretory pathway pseudopilin PulG